MGKKIIFTCDIDGDFQLECFADSNNRLAMSIEDTNADHVYNIQSIVLDRDTALELIDYLKDQVELLEI